MSRVREMVALSIKIVNKNPAIFLITLVFSFLPVYYSKFQVHAVIKLVLVLLSLGWLGTKFAMLYRAYSEKKLNWSRFWVVLIKYLRKLLPAVVLLAILGLIPLMVAALVFAKWFVSEYLSGDAKMLGNELIEQVVLAMNNPRLWVQFVRQNIWLNVLSQVLGLLILVGTLVVKLFLSVLVVEEVGLWKAVGRVGKFLQQNVELVGWYLVFRVMINLAVILVGGVSFLVGEEVEMVDLISGSVLASGWWWIAGLLATYLGLILDAFVLVYYMERREGKGVVGKLKRVVGKGK